MFTKCLVLAQNHAAAASLARFPNSPFTYITNPREVPSRGGVVLGVVGLHGYSVARALGAGTGDLLIVAWNLHPNDHALRVAGLSFPTPDPQPVIRATKPFFPSDTRPHVEYIPPPMSAFMKRVMANASVSAVQIPRVRPSDMARMPASAAMSIRTGVLTTTSAYALVRDLAIQMEVAPALALAVADVESGFNPNATSSAGAMGLMQLMPSTAQTLHISNPYDPTANVTGGLSLLKLYAGRYSSISEVLAAYHSGSAHLQRNGITPSDTIYIHKVVERWHFYEHLIADALVPEDPIGDAIMIANPTLRLVR
jgi:hypothetical protein